MGYLIHSKSETPTIRRRHSFRHFDIPVDGHDLWAALDAVLSGKKVLEAKAGMGCTIKWKPGNAPAYTRQ